MKKKVRKKKRSSTKVAKKNPKKKIYKKKSKTKKLSKKEEVLIMFDEKFFRMWEFYLTGCEIAFKWGDQVVFQFQLTKDFSSTPNIRDYIY